MTCGRRSSAWMGAFGWLSASPAKECAPGSSKLVALMEYLPKKSRIFKLSRAAALAEWCQLGAA